MTEREARIAFNLVAGVGSVKVDAMARACGGDVVEAYRRLPDKKDWKGDVPDWRGEIARAEKLHVKILTACDDGWPERFRDLASPPLAVYVCGDVAALSRKGVALVGTRRATAYGRFMAERIAFDLAKSGWCVFSGLAMGIDAAAHRGALAGGGTTVGILGGAVDRFYPVPNRPLAREIVDKGGAVMSEFPFGRPPDSTTFPQRNRLVAALARGVVAVEAPAKSGTLITCSLALDVGRAVMAVPGRADDAYSAGCLQLIREGAPLVCNAVDVVEELNPLNRRQRPQPTRRPREAQSLFDLPKLVPPPEPEQKLTVEEAAVLKAIPDDGATVDRVAMNAKLSAARANVLLVGLRLKRRVKFLPGNRVVKAD